ncbi:hypothetical protein [Pararhizobium sp. IMCC21322]|uniref:hypothetical protein n=1 Tax=Pararhizobium sp. IMCC21322 TaxID=3067903 RepID=UPI002742987E|nr:hypothetical protein [Pararhizobium sp. IMCC21322]
MTISKFIAPAIISGVLALSGSVAFSASHTETESEGTFNASNDGSPDAQTPGKTGTADTNNATAETGDTMRNCESSGVFNSANDSAPDAMTPGCTGSAVENNGTAETDTSGGKESSGVFNAANETAPDAQTPGKTGTANSN